MKGSWGESEAKKAGPEKTRGNSRDRRKTGAEEGCPRDSSNHTVTEIATNTDSGTERTLDV